MTKPATVYRTALGRVCCCAVLCTVSAAWAAPPTTTPASFTQATLEVSSSTLAPPSAVAPLRLDMTQWLPAGSAGSLGFSLGLRSTQYERTLTHPQLGTAWEPTLGVHWRSQLSGSTRLELATWARAPYASNHSMDVQSLIWMSSPAPYGARLEVQWAAPRFGGLLPEFGAVGLQLEGNSQLLLRARAGGPMLYYRSRF